MAASKPSRTPADCASSHGVRVTLAGPLLCQQRVVNKSLDAERKANSRAASSLRRAESFQKQVQELSADVVATRAENTRLRALVTQSQAEADAAIGQAHKAQKHAKELRKQLDVAVAHGSSLEQRCKELQAAIDLCESLLARCRQHLVDEEREVSTLQDQYDQMEHRAAKFKAMAAKEAARAALLAKVKSQTENKLAVAVTEKNRLQRLLQRGKAPRARGV